MNIVFLGLSITSSWGNGHATTYRALIRALAGRGHEVLFLERDVEWYAANRDLPHPEYCHLALYGTLAELRAFAPEVAEADAVILGSYVPEGIAVGEWILRTAQGVTAFYDIDTPVTLAKLQRGECEYLAPALIPRFDFYASFTGGPVLETLERDYGAQRAHPLYCSVDEERYFPEPRQKNWELGYLGTYSADRQPGLERLLFAPARALEGRRFVVAGPMYPASGIAWPANVHRIEHLSPGQHRAFYNSQRFTLNVTRPDMVRAGWSPSVRLFEAAACATPIITDHWEGLSDFLTPGREIFVARSAEDVRALLSELDSCERDRVARAGQARVLAEHTAAHRAAALESFIREAATPGSLASGELSGFAETNV